MLFNKNIILEILQSDFGEQIDAMIENCVMDLDADGMDTIFEYPADYALLDGIEEMYVTEYELEESNGLKTISGVLEIRAMVSAYAHWDDEEVHVDDAICIFGLGFEFDIIGEKYSNLQLEYVY